MNALKSRLNMHFAACAAVAATAVVAAPQQAEAAIVYSGTVNLVINSDFNGLYLNVGNGAYNTTGGGGSTVPGWDINIYSASGISLFAPAAATNYMSVGTSNNLASGTLVSAASTFSTVTGTTVWNLSSSNNFIGFRFFKEGDAAGTFHYGWARLSLSTSTFSQPRLLVDYAYDDTVGTGINVGAGVPAPGALALLGLAGLVGGRRRRN